MGTVRFSENVIQNAQKIVNDCMGTEDSFCKSRCPMSTDVKKYIHCISEQKYGGGRSDSGNIISAQHSGSDLRTSL